MRLFFLASLLLWRACIGPDAAAAPADAGTATGWTTVRRTDGVEISRTQSDDAPSPAIRGRVHIDAPAGDVHRLISDYDHFAGFIPLVAESRVLERQAETTSVYQRLQLPFPFADRHYVIRVSDAAHGAILEVRWQLDRAQSASLPANARTPNAFGGSWLLRDLPDGGGCDARYTIQVDPGGGVPRWLFLRLIERYVAQVMQIVRDRAEAAGGR